MRAEFVECDDRALLVRCRRRVDDGYRLIARTPAGDQQMPR